MRFLAVTLIVTPQAEVWPRPLRQQILVCRGSATSKESVDLAARCGDPVRCANVTSPTSSPGRGATSLARVRLHLVGGVGVGEGLAPPRPDDDVTTESPFADSST